MGCRGGSCWRSCGAGWGASGGRKRRGVPTGSGMGCCGGMGGAGGCGVRWGTGGAWGGGGGGGGGSGGGVGGGAVGRRVDRGAGEVAVVSQQERYTVKLGEGRTR